MTPKISAFPKCYINDIGPNKRMTLFQWIDMSLELESDGLEIYAPFLESCSQGILPYSLGKPQPRETLGTVPTRRTLGFLVSRSSP